MRVHYRYAQVSEGAGSSSTSQRRRRYTVCAEESREQVVYTSSSNVLNVEITDTVLADLAINFLIKYTGKRKCTFLDGILSSTNVWCPVCR